VAPIPGTLEIDRSCREAVGLFFLVAWCWLGLGLLLLLLGGIQTHVPVLFSNTAALSFGRVVPAAIHCLLYGFALPAGLAVSLWLICRLGRARLHNPPVIAAGFGFWNVGILLGLWGILSGASTGQLGLEAPGYVAPVLFIGYLIIAVCALLTFHFRRVTELYASQWVILAALFWFPWVYSSAELLLVFFPVRGALQGVIDAWYIQNVAVIWICLMGLAVLFYFIPKLLARPLYSRSLAAFAFWLLLIFGSASGMPASLPVPRWIPALSEVCGVFAGVGMGVAAAVLLLTARGEWARWRTNRVLKFVLFALCAFVVASIADVVGSLRGASRSTDMTLYRLGVFASFFTGVFLAAMTGAAYFILPRIFAREFKSPKLAGTNFALLAAGAVFFSMPLLAGGLVQGAAMNNPAKPFVDVARGTIPFVGTSLIGILLLLAGVVLFLTQLCDLLLGGVRLWFAGETRPRTFGGRP